MKVFRYRADIIPITLITLFFLVDIWMYLWIQNLPFLLVYVFFGMGIKGFICPWNHHHQHSQTFYSPFLNRFLEIIYWFQTGIVGYAWVLHHNLGHHLHYQDQMIDESAWKSPNGKIYSSSMYTWIVMTTAYYRAWKVGKSYPKIQRYFLIMAIIQMALLISLIVYHPIQGILIFLLPMISSLTLTVYTTYDHHTGLETDDPYASSYNILTPWYNLITGNLGYHTAHHMKGSLHWSKLPDFHKEIVDKIDKKYYKDYRIL
jgi:fatty acid desaturase